MQPRSRRAGSREGALSERLRAALEAEGSRLAKVEDPVEAIRAVGDFNAQLDLELEFIVDVRRHAVRALREDGWTYQRIAEATGLSEARVAQLARSSGVGGRIPKKG
jgi:DNA-directed RNA polymerase specialized sigma24 family protein